MKQTIFNGCNFIETLCQLLVTHFFSPQTTLLNLWLYVGAQKVVHRVGVEIPGKLFCQSHLVGFLLGKANDCAVPLPQKKNKCELYFLPDTWDSMWGQESSRQTWHPCCPSQRTSEQGTCTNHGTWVSCRPRWFLLRLPGQSGLHAWDQSWASLALPLWITLQSGMATKEMV